MMFEWLWFRFWSSIVCNFIRPESREVVGLLIVINRFVLDFLVFVFHRRFVLGGTSTLLLLPLPLNHNYRSRCFILKTCNSYHVPWLMFMRRKISLIIPLCSSGEGISQWIDFLCIVSYFENFSRCHLMKNFCEFFVSCSFTFIWYFHFILCFG